MEAPLDRRLGIALGGLFLAFALAEVLGHRTDLAWPPLVRAGALVGGGALVLVGVLVPFRWPYAGPLFVSAGALLGIYATAWTVVVPVLAILVVALVFRQAHDRVDDH